ncbi:MAG: serine/threonine protein kinase [Acidimicrobiales bacterium]|jgi:serine/threonine-protein kinase|nr:serine/threonine protein kinase [Acidimicrobiales bacterium]
MFGEDADIWVGRQFGPYNITSLLGRGTVAHVYRAEIKGGSEEVGLKILTPFAEARAEIRELFEQEHRLMKRLKHPNVLDVDQAGTIAGTHYMEIGIIAGRTIWQIVQEQKRLNITETISITKQICMALNHVHENNIVHRDVKPSNVMLTDNGQAILFDFGLAHDLQGPPPPEGRVFGSPMFLAPEQALGHPVDQRTDLYCLGATLYRLAVGAAPFYGERKDLLHAHVNLTPPDPRDAGVPDALANLILRSMSKNPDERFQSGNEFADELSGLGVIEPETPTKRSLIQRITRR